MMMSPTQTKTTTQYRPKSPDDLIISPDHIHKLRLSAGSDHDVLSDRGMDPDIRKRLMNRLRV